jgi:hypothetical protein
MASPTTAGPTHRVQSAVEVYGFPRGHLGHLSPEEEEALTDFKLLCEQNGYYSPGNGSTEAPSHEDATLLSRLHHLSGYILLLTDPRRFLRARRFVVAEAWKQFHTTEDWRKATQLDQLYETIDIEHYEETRRLVSCKPPNPGPSISTNV